MPTVHPDNLSARIARAREAFDRGETTDGQPLPTALRKEMEQGLCLSEEMRRAYLLAAEFGVKRNLIEVSEFHRIHSAMTGVTDPETGWNQSADFATKVIVTKVCNELLEVRGDA